MLNAAQLRERIAADFPDAVQVGESVVRFVRKADSQPYAVCYLDVSDRLPSDQDALTRYQDGVIGKRYFDDKKNLQWSNYLYFVTTPSRLASKELVRVRKLIEADRSYARKFVISEDEIDEVLSPAPIVPTGADQLPSILATWTQKLADAGLDEAVLGEGDNPARLAAIEASSGRPVKRLSDPKPASRKREPAPPFILSFELTKYRDFPLRRRFDFGSVNLIVGPNAAGKTSLLEAIELYYCGRNKRSPEKGVTYELIAKLANGKTDRATSSRSQQSFRDLNLGWYGQPERNTNTLYRSFARFNFLDTDAAVHMSDSPVNIADDLAKLLIGPDASTVWRNMERVAKAADDRQREIGRLRKQVDEERIPLGQRIEAASKIKIESEPLLRRLNEMLESMRWKQRNDLGDLIPALSELAALINQALGMKWVAAPISLAALRRFVASAKADIKKAEPAVYRLQQTLAAQKQLEGSIARANAALPLAQQIKRMIDAGIVQRDEERSQLRDRIARDSQRLAMFEAPTALSAAVSLVVARGSLASEYAAAQSRKKAAEQALQQARAAHAQFISLRDRSASLAQQLRQIASKILEGGAKPDECPLCHTRFPPGELASHMALGVDPHVENLSQNLLTQITQCEAALQSAQNMEIALARLHAFAGSAGLPSNASVDMAQSALAQAIETLATARGRLLELDQQANVLAGQGVTAAELQRTGVRLAELQYPLSAATAQAVASLLAAIERDRTECGASLQRNAAQIDNDVRTLRGILNGPQTEPSHYAMSLSRLKENAVNSEAVAGKLARIAKSYPWREDMPLAELLVSIKSLSSLAADLQAALARERQQQALLAGSVKRKTELDKQADDLAKSNQRFEDASSSLKSLMSEHSLNGAMASALSQNRSAIEAIFSRIHAPAEFSGLGNGFDTLVRRSGGEARLSEISTGQRSAFALSIFLAQNSQLQSAPQVMLIDDPIAHVDDLNALSFLDYLRDVALDNRRQIFFATANDKIATLFERKFDFLGKKYQRIQLAREE